MKIKDNTLYADEGMILTNGTIYGKEIYLADGADASLWCEVSKEEYDIEGMYI